MTKIYFKDTIKEKIEGETKEKMKRKEGITLIALVVTIIVLIILAGVSINLILGQNGIIAKAKEGKIKHEIGALKEKMELNIADQVVNATEQGHNVTLKDLQEENGTYSLELPEDTEWISKGQNPLELMQQKFLIQIYEDLSVEVSLLTDTVSVEMDLTNCSLSNCSKRVIRNTNYQTKINTIDPEYCSINEIKILAGGEDITSQVYNETTKMIYIENVTTDINIKVDVSIDFDKISQWITTTEKNYTEKDDGSGEKELDPEKIGTNIKDIFLDAEVIGTGFPLIIKTGENFYQIDEEGNYGPLVELDIFALLTSLGAKDEQLNEYGIEGAWSNCEDTTFTIGHMAGGHWTGYGRGWSSTFTFDMSYYEKLIKPNSIHADFGLGSDGDAWINANIVVTYKDDTTDTSDTVGGTYRNPGARYETPLDLAVNEEKEIKTITISLWRMGL